MAEASIPVDLKNPGQVFACLGFLEAAEILLGEAGGGFNWQDENDVRFRLAAFGSDDPVVRVLRFLDEAAVTSLAPAGSLHDTHKWKVETRKTDSKAFPFRDTGPDVLPACLSDRAGNHIRIDHWGDQAQARRDRVKFWAGSNGYPGAGLVRDALDLIDGRAVDHARDPFSLDVEQKSGFRLDWRRDYVPIDAGFSRNAHKSAMIMRGYPIVELMAAIGLTNARPIRRTKLEYIYGVAGLVGEDLYDPIFLRAALGTERPPFPGMPFRLFNMQLDWPGQEGQARCITNITEKALPS